MIDHSGTYARLLTIVVQYMIRGILIWDDWSLWDVYKIYDDIVGWWKTYKNEIIIAWDDDNDCLV